jgi:hypothetical protein
MKSHTPKIRRSRLDGLFFVVILLWLVTSMLLVLLRQPGTAHAVQPHQASPELVGAYFSATQGAP